MEGTDSRLGLLFGHERVGQDEDLSREAGRFALRLVPGLFPYFAFKVLLKHLQTQDILLPGVVIGILANLFNVAANWMLIEYLMPTMMCAMVEILKSALLNLKV